VSDKDANATMKILSALLLALALLPAAHAQSGDPLKSAACGEALAQLQAGRAAGNGAAPQPLRDRAAQACLGGGSTPQRSARVLQQPISVAPPVITPPVPPGPIAAPPQLPPPPVAIQRAPLPTHCDAGGCWASDGNSLRHIGPNLAGPNGLCTQQAGQVFCP
jgi:hypothetical protein